MKKFSLVLIVLAVFSAGVFAMSKNKMVSVTGHVQFYGNVPVTFAGFVTVEGNEYTIDVEEGSDIQLIDFNSLSGELLELTGVVVAPSESGISGFNELKDGHFVVHSYKILR